MQGEVIAFPEVLENLPLVLPLDAMKFELIDLLTPKIHFITHDLTTHEFPMKFTT